MNMDDVAAMVDAWRALRPIYLQKWCESWEACDSVGYRTLKRACTDVSIENIQSSEAEGLQSKGTHLNLSFSSSTTGAGRVSIAPNSRSRPGGCSAAVLSRLSLNTTSPDNGKNSFTYLIIVY
jgi:hypothetical protein